MQALTFDLDLDSVFRLSSLSEARFTNNLWTGGIPERWTPP